MKRSNSLGEYSKDIESPAISKVEGRRISWSEYSKRERKDTYSLIRE